MGTGDIWILWNSVDTSAAASVYPQVSAIIANLRNVANDMGNTIRAQNAALERIDAKQNSDIQRVGMAVQKAGELMS